MPYLFAEGGNENADGFPVLTTSALLMPATDAQYCARSTAPPTDSAIG